NIAAGSSPMMSPICGGSCARDRSTILSTSAGRLPFWPAEEAHDGCGGTSIDFCCPEETLRREVPNGGVQSHANRLLGRSMLPPEREQKMHADECPAPHRSARCRTAIRTCPSGSTGLGSGAIEAGWLVRSSRTSHG